MFAFFFYLESKIKKNIKPDIFFSETYSLDVMESSIFPYCTKKEKSIIWYEFPWNTTLYCKDIILSWSLLPWEILFK